MPDSYRPSYPDKRQRSSLSPSDGIPKKMRRTDGPSSRTEIPSLRDFTSRNTADRRSPSRSSSRRSSVSKGNGNNGSESSHSLAISPNHSDSAIERIPPAFVVTSMNETVDDLVERLLKATNASALYNVAVQRAASAQKEYDNTKKSFAAFPPLAEQKKNRKVLADREVANAKLTLQNLRASLSEILKKFFTSLGDRAQANVSSAEYVSRDSHNKVLTELEKARLEIQDAGIKAIEAKRIADEVCLKHEETTIRADDSRRQADEAIQKMILFETQLRHMQESISSFQQFRENTTQALDTLKNEKISMADIIRSNSVLIGSAQQENLAYKVKVDKHATDLEALLREQKNTVAMLEEERIKVRALEKDRATRKDLESNVQELKKRVDAIDSKVMNNRERAFKDIVQQSKALEALEFAISKDTESSAVAKTDIASSSEIEEIKASLQHLREEIFGTGEGHDLEGQGRAIAYVNVTRFLARLLTRKFRLRSSLTRLSDLETNTTAIQTSLTEAEEHLRDEIGKIHEVAQSKDELFDELLQDLDDKVEKDRRTLADSFESLREEVRLAVLKMDKAPPTFPSIEHIKQELDNKIEGSVQGLVAFKNTVTKLRKADVQRLDVLTQITQDLERRFSSIQTEDLYHMIIHQMQTAFPAHIPQLQHIMDKIRNLAIHVDQQIGNSNGRIGAVEARASTVAVALDGKLEGFERKLDSLSAHRAPSAGVSEIASIKKELLELQTTWAPQIEALETRVNKISSEQLRADSCTLNERLSSLHERVVSQHADLKKRIEHTQGWLSTIIRESYGDLGDVPDWEQQNDT